MNHTSALSHPRRVFGAMRAARQRSSYKWATRIEAPALPDPGRLR